jgi:negative regulator of flagellin synthesis FlgM
MKVGLPSESLIKVNSNTAGGQARAQGVATDKSSPVSAPSTGAAGGPSSAGTTVALSSTASSLLQEAGSTPEFDAAKVQRISQAISEGRFTIDASAIADKLIANAQELLDRTSA